MVRGGTESDHQPGVGIICLYDTARVEPGKAWRSLLRCSTVISQHTGLRARVVDPAASSAAQAVNRLIRQDNLAALVELHCMLGVSPAPGLAGLGVPAVSDLDALAITLTAAVLTTLSRVRRPTARGRIVVVGADTLPILVPLLVAAEAGNVVMWRPTEQPGFPLCDVIAEADVVVNLLDSDGECLGLVRQDRVAVVTLDPFRDPLFVLPALVGLTLADPPVRLASEEDLGTYCDVCHACAMALVRATPPDRTYPSAATHHLTERLMASARVAIRENPRRH